MGIYGNDRDNRGNFLAFYGIKWDNILNACEFGGFAGINNGIEGEAADSKGSIADTSCHITELDETTAERIEKRAESYFTNQCLGVNRFEIRRNING